MAKYIPLLLMMALSPMHAADSTRPAANAINALGIDLLKVSAKPWENTLLSPYSIQSALAMTYAGAEGETKEQMVKALHYPKGDVHAPFNALMKELEKANGDSANLVLANRLFGQKGYAFRPTFLDLVKDKYDAPLEQVDFRENAVSATKTINTWVEKQTRDRIRNLIPSPLSPDSRLVLVNAIYMKARWQEKFKDRQLSKPKTFHLPGGNSIEVPTMFQNATYGYAKNDGYSAISLPYADSDLQFLIILPDAVDGLPALEKKLTPALLADNADLKPRKLLLYLPRFKLQPPLFQLSGALQGLGMKFAFNIPVGSANFDGIAPRNGSDYLFISEVLHKTFIDVDEEGTEAAAATAVIMVAGAVPMKEPPTLVVQVNHPFLFAIQHRPSGACLFLGRVVNPKG